MKKHWPIFFYLLITGLLFYTNYIQSTILTGWDNLHPEFNFGINLKRSIFAVWQEYQGLGLLGGMGHAAALPHQIFLAISSLILPSSLIRYVYIFLLLFFGAYGTYRLIYYVLNTQSLQKMAKLSPTIPFIGGLFYLLNLATIQTFYVPFESFTVHFAALPWLLYSGILYFKNPTIRNTVLLIVVLLLSAPAAYIPTLFLVYILSLFLLLAVLIAFTPTIKNLIRMAKLGIIICAINAFWLLPFVYFTLTNSSVNINAKINQMATETIFLQNKETGNLQDVMILKGFLFNSVEPNTNGVLDYMLKPWRVHFENPIIVMLGYLFFAIILIGTASVFITKRKLSIAFFVLFLFAFTMLATNVEPFVFLNELFRKIPLFNQAFRFPFTKFSILTALVYAIFFASGLQTIFNLFEKKFSIFNLKFEMKSKFKNLNVLNINNLLKTSNFKFQILTLIFTTLLITFSLPAFTGHLFYEKEKLVLPQEYKDTFNYFTTKAAKNTRIANFPQNTFWGWSYYEWGYGGSGFLWYGIQQPILDRAFDVWGTTSENYYYEITNALYSKNARAFSATLNKYQVGYILVDKNIYSTFSPQALFTQELEDLVKDTQSISRAATFGKIDIYKVNFEDKTNNFVFFAKNLPTANSYTWTSLDQAYLDHGNYISQQTFNSLLRSNQGQLSSLSLNSQLSTFNYYYPFRSLFTLKSARNDEGKINIEKDSIVLVKEIANIQEGEHLLIPSFLENEDMIPATFVSSVDENGNTIIQVQLKTPEVFINGKKEWGEDFEIPLFIIPENSVNFPLNLNINGLVNFSTNNSNTKVGTTSLSIIQDNIVTITDRKSNISQDYLLPASALREFTFLERSSIELPLSEGTRIEVKIPKVEDSYLGFQPDLARIEKVKDCDRFRIGSINSQIRQEEKRKVLSLSSANATACTSLYLPTLLHKQGYIISLENRNVKGRPLHFWILNEDNKFAPLDLYLPKNDILTPTSLILSPMEQYGRAYSFHLDSMSIGDDTSENEVGNIVVYPIPYNFITSMHVSGQEETESIASTYKYQVEHPNESLYVVSNLSVEKSQPSTTLVLSQSYDPGWKAYEIASSKWPIANSIKRYFPFLFGKEIPNHVMVNNWENGWTFNNSQFSTFNSQLIIVYLPQYLEYLGFLMLALYMDWLIDPFKRIRGIMLREIKRHFLRKNNNKLEAPLQ